MTIEYGLHRRWHDLGFSWAELSLILLLFLIANLPVSAQDPVVLKPITCNLRSASAMSVAPTGSIFIVETDNNRIVEYDTTGQPLDSLGNYGFGDYQFDEPVDVDATNGLKIYVSDRGNNRIQIFDRHLQYLSSIADASNNPQASTYYPTTLCIDNQGDLFFYDDRSNYIFRFDHYGKYDRGFNTQAIGTIHKPSDMMCADNRLYLADPIDGVIHMLNTGGGYLGFIAHTGKVRGLALGRDGIWAVSSRSLERYDMHGRLLGTQNLSITEDPVDVKMLGNTLYILTPSCVYKGIIPRTK